MKPSGVRGAWLAEFLSRSVSNGLDLPAPDIATPIVLRAFSHTPLAEFHGRLRAAPHARRLVVLGLDPVEQALVLGELLCARRNDDQRWPLALPRPCFRSRARGLELDR